jgi:hypothetical protein
LKNNSSHFLKIQGANENSLAFVILSQKEASHLASLAFAILSFTRPDIFLYRNKSKREGCRSLSPLFHLTAPPHKIEKALFAAAEAERQSRLPMASFLSDKLGIKTTGQWSPCMQCVQSKRNPLLGNKIMYHAMLQAFGKKPSPLSDELVASIINRVLEQQIKL